MFSENCPLCNKKLIGRNMPHMSSYNLFCGSNIRNHYSIIFADKRFLIEAMKLDNYEIMRYSDGEIRIIDSIDYSKDHITIKNTQIDIYKLNDDKIKKLLMLV